MSEEEFERLDRFSQIVRIKYAETRAAEAAAGAVPAVTHLLMESLASAEPAAVVTGDDPTVAAVVEPEEPAEKRKGLPPPVIVSRAKPPGGKRIIGKA